MTWDDIEEILCYGSEEEIKALKCPNCGGDIYHIFGSGLEYGCKKCGRVSRCYFPELLDSDDDN